MRRKFSSVKEEERRAKRYRPDGQKRTNKERKAQAKRERDGRR